MRNKHGGTCYRCNEWCDPGKGHFERRNGRWRVQHESCRLNVYAAREAVWHSEGFAKAMTEHPEWTRERCEKEARKYVQQRQRERREAMS